MFQFKRYRDSSCLLHHEGMIMSRSRSVIRDPKIRYRVVNKRPSVDLLTF